MEFLSTLGSGNVSLDFMLANYIFAMLLIFFVFFIFLRMMSNTKTAGVLIVILGIAFTGYILYKDKEFLHGVLALQYSLIALAGVGICVISAIGFFFGFLDEEETEEYIHKKGYWAAMVVLAYLGTFCVALGTNVAPVVPV